MDPKALANLDPKLRETYERVMGTTTNQGATTAAVPQTNFYTSASPASPPPSTNPMNGALSPTQPTVTPVNTVDPATELSPPVTQPTTTPPDQNTNPTQQPIQTAQLGAQQASPQTINPYANPLPSPASIAAQSKEVSPILRILYIVGAVIFFAAYTFFWIRVFNLQLPFWV